MITLHGPATSLIDRLDPRYSTLIAASARLAKKDPTLWGKDAQKLAATRLNWVDLPRTSRTLLPELDALAAKFRNFSRVVLCGMGGSSLGPEVIAASYKKNLFVLDSTDPQHVAQAIAGDLSTTVVIVSSKSGSTIETSSQRSLFEESFLTAGLNPIDHMVIVTDPHSPLDQDARARGFIVVNADPDVGGRFSALSAFGLVPAALIGVDVSVLLDSADDAIESFHRAHSTAADVAYLISFFTEQYISLNDADSPLPGLGDWIEQLIAESTGKDGIGRLPIVIESSTAPVSGTCLSISFSQGGDLVVQGPLGAQFIFWEWVTALVGVALHIDPFNQPNVTTAKEQTATLLSQWDSQLPQLVPTSSDGSIDIYSQGKTVTDTLMALIDSVAPDGYIAIMAYCDRFSDRELAQLRSILAQKSGRPVTFGWGPRFLHSTGQFHKGGQTNGVFLQITADAHHDLAIPGESFSFHTLLMAQALGDALTLNQKSLQVSRLHMRNREIGVSEILLAAREIV